MSYFSPYNNRLVSFIYVRRGHHRQAVNSENAPLLAFFLGESVNAFSPTHFLGFYGTIWNVLDGACAPARFDLTELIGDGRLPASQEKCLNNH